MWHAAENMAMVGLDFISVTLVLQLVNLRELLQIAANEVTVE